MFTPQTFPNAARPNNVVAPFWTDINPAAGGAIRIGTLTDGVEHVDRRRLGGVSRTSATRRRTRSRCGSGIGAAACERADHDHVRQPAQRAGDPGSGINSGAENRDGTSGKNLAAEPPANNTDFTINLTPPQAGGTQTVTYDVSATRDGIFSSLAGADVERHTRHHAGARRADGHEVARPDRTIARPPFGAASRHLSRRPRSLSWLEVASTQRKYDLYGPDFRADPQRVFAQMREHDPVVCQPGIDGESMIWFVTRHDDAAAMLLDDKRFVRDQRLALTEEELAESRCRRLSS